MTAEQQVIARLEDEFNALARQAEDAPHRWGEDEEARLGELAAQLQAAYDAAGVDDFDRIQL